MSGTIFQLVTLVDITGTGVVRSSNAHDLQRNQQRNYETVLQVLGLRTQPHVLAKPEVIDIAGPELVKSWFGETYHYRTQRVWVLHFRADRDDAYAISDDAVGGLLQDFEQVPVITGLTDTASFLLPIFYPHGAIKNIHITAHLKA